MQKILIVEDDEVIAQSLKEHLEKWNYEVKAVEDFENVMSTFETFDPMLVLLDISLPYFNGYHWCQQIRKVSQVPIIFISSTNENMNIVMAMNMGADDFINKPFDINVLTAKVQALLRRTYAFSKEFHILSYKNFLLDLLGATLEYQGEIIHLTKNEVKIMQILFEKPETIVSREDIMVELWQSDEFVDDNTLSVNVNRLRRKIEDLGVDNIILTKKGIGYMLQYEEL